MCDLKYLFQPLKPCFPMAIWRRGNQKSMLFGVTARRIAGIALVLVLLVWCLLLLPDALDQALGIVAPKISNIK